MDANHKETKNVLRFLYYFFDKIIHSEPLSNMPAATAKTLGNNVQKEDGPLTLNGAMASECHSFQVISDRLRTGFCPWLCLMPQPTIASKSQLPRMRLFSFADTISGVWLIGVATAVATFPMAEGGFFCDCGASADVVNITARPRPWK